MIHFAQAAWSWGEGVPLGYRLLLVVVFGLLLGVLLLWELGDFPWQRDDPPGFDGEVLEGKIIEMGER